MAHLKSGTNGHLLSNSDGHLIHKCGATTVPCNDCDPALPSEYNITFSGLSGNFDPFNGTHTVLAADWAECVWETTVVNSDDLKLQWNEDYISWKGAYEYYWEIRVKGGYCGIIFTDNNYFNDEIDPQPCDPVNIGFSIDSCDDSGCSDHNSCSNSSGASVSVSET